MAHSASAKKSIRQNLKHRALNRWRKRSFRDLMKDYDEAILHADVDACESKLGELYKRLDQVAATGTLHRNTASRYKSRLAAKLNKKRAGLSGAAALGG